MRYAPLVLLLAACGPSGVSVYDENDNRVGEVTWSVNRATVYDRGETIVGTVEGNNVYDRGDNRVGRIRADGNIEDRNGNRVGRVRDGTRCVDRRDSSVGSIAQDIDDEAAGGACLLLTLR